MVMWWKFLVIVHLLLDALVVALIDDEKEVIGQDPETKKAEEKVAETEAGYKVVECAIQDRCGCYPNRIQFNLITWSKNKDEKQCKQSCNKERECSHAIMMILDKLPYCGVIIGGCDVTSLDNSVTDLQQSKLYEKTAGIASGAKCGNDSTCVWGNSCKKKKDGIACALTFAANEKETSTYCVCQPAIASGAKCGNDSLCVFGNTCKTKIDGITCALTFAADANNESVPTYCVCQPGIASDEKCGKDSTCVWGNSCKNKNGKACALTYADAQNTETQESTYCVCKPDPETPAEPETPVNGGWGVWSSWRGGCDKLSWKQFRTRLCDNPTTENGGKSCPRIPLYKYNYKQFRKCIQSQVPAPASCASKFINHDATPVRGKVACYWANEVVSSTTCATSTCGGYYSADETTCCVAAPPKATCESKFVIHGVTGTGKVACTKNDKVVSSTHTCAKSTCGGTGSDDETTCCVACKKDIWRICKAYNLYKEDCESGERSDSYKQYCCKTCQESKNKPVRDIWGKKWCEENLKNKEDCERNTNNKTYCRKTCQGL